MDPNIMKFLEEDEDETMHSGADVEAFTAELNRDIEGNNASTSQPQLSDSDGATLSQGSSQTTTHFLPQWQTSSAHEGIVNFQSAQEQHVLESENRKDDALPHNSSADATEQKNDGTNFPVSDPMATTQISREQPIHIQEPIGESNPERESQIGKLQNISNRPTMAMVSNDQQSFSTGSQHSAGMVMSGQQAMMTSGLSNQPSMMTSGGQQQGTTSKLNKQVPFGMLLPIIQPQLDKDRALQLHTLYIKLKRNEITKDGFIRHMRGIVGDQMLKMAVYKLQTQDAMNTQTTASQFQSQPQASARKMQTQIPSDLTNSTSGGNTTQSRDETQADLPTSSSGALSQDRKHPAFTTQGLNKQQHMHLSQTSFPTYGSSGSSYSPFSATSAAPQMRQAPAHQNMTGATTRPTMLNAANFDRPHSLGDPRKIQAGSLGHMNNNTAMQQKIGVASSMPHVKQEPVDPSSEQHKTSHGLSSLSRAPIKQGSGAPGSLTDESFEIHSSRTAFNPSTSLGPTNSISPSMPSPMETSILSNPRSITSPIGTGNNSKAPPKKPLVGQKKPMEAPGSSPPSSKKQKVSGAFSDQSIEHLNDVTAVSGVNLREEEEQLFSGSKEDSRVSEASRRAVQEEEERLILNKTPLQKKVVEIMAKCGLKNMSNDVERCLSLCVEERMRGLISNVIRLSKQRVDFEKPRHKTIVTSDVRQQIMAINRKAREEWDKKQAETEKSQKPDDPESTSGGDGDKDKDERSAKSTKVNKEEDDKMRATAANVAVRAATGVGDMLSRWQLMIEAKQKQGGSDSSSSGSQPGKDVARKPSATSTKNTRENQETEKRDPSGAAFTSPASVRKVGRNQVVVPRVARSISVKDVIGILEREPQMSKSTLLYRLYNKVGADTAIE